MDKDNRSNLVKKLFYRDQDTKSNKQTRSTNEDQSVVPETVQKILEQKKDQLDKAIKYYNSEMTKLSSQKLALENQEKKLKAEQRDFDNLKKKQKLDFEKLKEDEQKKLQDQKRVLEQRQRNISIANTSSKRDRDEMDMLRKQLTTLKEETQTREKYQKSQIERLSRQVHDLRQENQELKDEIAAYDQQLREAREVTFNQQKPPEKRGSGIGVGLFNKAAAQVNPKKSTKTGYDSVIDKNFGQTNKIFKKSQTLEEFENNEKEVEDMLSQE